MNNDANSMRQKMLLELNEKLLEQKHNYCIKNSLKKLELILNNFV